MLNARNYSICKIILKSVRTILFLKQISVFSGRRVGTMDGVGRMQRHLRGFRALALPGLRGAVPRRGQLLRPCDGDTSLRHYQLPGSDQHSANIPRDISNMKSTRLPALFQKKYSCMPRA